MVPAIEHRATIVSIREGRGRVGVVSMPLVLVAATLVFAYRAALAALVAMWDASPMYSYGYTVPLVSAYLLWSRREVWRRLAPRPSWTLGTAVLLLAIVMTVAARAGGIQIVEQLALLVALTAAVLLLFGRAHLRAAWAGLAYLLLMIPIWDGFTEPLHEPFQQRSAAIGVWLLHLIGVPAFREGTFITLPNMQLEVARVCSGVNYLVAVVALGLPLGYVFLRSNWRRALLLAVAVVVAALSNGLRVALIGALAYLDVGSPLHGPFHMLHGLFVAGIGYVVLFVGLSVLTRAESKGEASMVTGVRAPSPDAAAAGRALPRWGAAGAVAALFVALGANVLSPAQHPLPLIGGLTLPRELGAWASAGVPIGGAGTAAGVWPGADAELSRRYVRDDGVVADVYVAYYASQKQGKEVITYRATELHAGASPLEVAGAADRGAFAANYVGANRDGIATLFWYEVKGRPEANHYLVKGRTLWGAMAEGDSSAAVIVLTTRTDPARAAGALQELARFVGASVADCLRARGQAEVEEQS